MSFSSTQIFEMLLRIIELYLIEFISVQIVLANTCPIQVVSNRLYSGNAKNEEDIFSKIFGKEQWENHDYSSTKPNILRPGPHNLGLLSSKEFNPDEKVNFRCQFIFIGAPEERVQLIFKEFRLRTKLRWIPNGFQNISQLRCDDEDHITAHVLVGSRMSKIDDFCGEEVPPQLMSTRNVITLDFDENKVENGADRYGWTIEYRFITDFGNQPKEAIILQENKNNVSSCSFLFNSSIKSQGSVWSPNYPGYYPRNVDCQYEFVGSEKQIVLISFEYFDVEGFGQCEETTQSDYILFSNYKTMDRTNRRYCGSQRPRRAMISSESNYFRMQFHSNDIFDGTGFYARYQFFDENRVSKNRLKFSTSAAEGRQNFPIIFRFGFIVTIFLSQLLIIAHFPTDCFSL